MAEKKNVSRAERAVSDVKKNHNASSKSSAKNSKGGKAADRINSDNIASVVARAQEEKTEEPAGETVTTEEKKDE